MLREFIIQLGHCDYSLCVIFRAFHDETGKIFSVLNAQEIDYDTSVHIEKMIMETNVTNFEYKLVFFVTKEASDRSYITTALDQYKRALPDVIR